MRLKIQLESFDTLESTNQTAKELKHKGEGLFVLAKTQKKGRGSAERHWHSPEGGLYLSGLLRPRPHDAPTVLSILAGAAISQSLRTLLPNSCKVSVKWPNDCLIANHKAAGILSEVVEDSESPLCVVGIGVNVNVPPDELKQFEANPFPATSMQIETANTPYDLERVCQTILLKLASLYETYWQEGFGSIREIWQSNCLQIDQQIEFEMPADSAQSKARRFAATLTGIDAKGGLQLTHHTGQTTTHYVGEIKSFL